MLLLFLMVVIPVDLTLSTCASWRTSFFCSNNQRWQVDLGSQFALGGAYQGYHCEGNAVLQGTMAGSTFHFTLMGYDDRCTLCIAFCIVYKLVFSFSIVLSALKACNNRSPQCTLHCIPPVSIQVQSTEQIQMVKNTEKHDLSHRRPRLNWQHFLKTEYGIGPLQLEVTWYKIQNIS